MKIKRKFVYHKLTGKLVGFIELGQIHEEFKQFQNSCLQEDGNNDDREFSAHVNVILVRDIFSALCYPFAYFATNGVTPSQLFTTGLEAVRVLTSVGFQVRAMVSGGASVNRKFFGMLANSAEENNWTWNPHYSTMKLYFFSDVPHLFKVNRNCFENSNWNKNTRNMHVRCFYIISLSSWLLSFLLSFFYQAGITRPFVVIYK